MYKDKTDIKFPKTYIFSLYCIFSIVSVTILSMFNIEKVEKWMLYSSMVIIFHFILTTYSLFKFRSSFMSLGYIFVVLTYLFHFGQIVLMGFFPNYRFQQFNILWISSMGTLKKASLYQLMVISLVVVGIMFSERKLKTIENVNDNYNKTAYIVGLLLWMFFFPVRLYLDFLKFKAVSNGNYLDVFYVGTRGIISTIGNLSFVGISIMIVELSKKNKKKAKMILFLAVSYLIGSMMYGGRGYQITVIIFYAYIYISRISGLKIRTLLLGIGYVFLFLTFINTIFLVRLRGLPNMKLLREAFSISLKSTPFLKAIEEVGSTQLTVTLVIDRTKEMKDAFLGINYLASIITALLINIQGFLDPLLYWNHYVKSLNFPGIGGSYIGELFINFRYFGLLFAPLIGLFVGNVSRKIEESLKAGDALMVGVLMPIFIDLLWWVRNAFGRWIRPFIMTFVIINFFHSILERNHQEL